MKLRNVRPFSLMTENKYIYCFLLVVTLLAVLFSLYFKNKSPVTTPFKCYSFTEYTLLNGGDIATFDSSQDLRIFNNGVAYLNFSGMVKSNNKETILNRTISLKNAKYLDKETVSFDIAGFQKSTSDNTPDELYNLLLNEYIYQDKKLNLDIVNINPSTWVLGTSSSFIMMCVEY